METLSEAQNLINAPTPTRFTPKNHPYSIVGSGKMKSLKTFRSVEDLMISYRLHRLGTLRVLDLQSPGPSLQSATGCI